MRAPVFAAVILALSASAVGQEAPKLFDADLAVRRQAIEGVVTGKHASEWRLLLEAYEKEPSEIRRAILETTPKFFDSYTFIVKDLPESQKWASISAQFQAEIEVIEADLRDASLDTAEERDRYKKRIDDLRTRFKFPGYGEIKATEQKVAAIGIDLLRKGLADPDPALGEFASQTLITVGLAHSELKQIGYGRCESGDQTWRTAAKAVEDLLQERTKLDPKPLLRIATAREGHYEVACLILASIKNPDVATVVRKLLRSQVEDEALVGIQCAIVWPSDEFWPSLLQLATMDDNRFAHADPFEAAIQAYPSAPAKLTAGWSRLSNVARRRILECIYTFRTRTAFNLALSSFGDPDPEVRMAAISTVTTIADESDEPTELTDADRGQVARAITSLIDDPDQAVQNRALEYLAPEDLPFETVASFVKNGSRRVRGTAAGLLAKYKDALAVPLLMALVGDSDEYLSSSGVDGLRELGDLAFTAVRRGLKDSNPNVRAGCASLVGESEDPSLADDLRRLLKDGSAKVRKAAVESIAVLGEETAKDILPLVQDKDEEVRSAAIGALVGMKGPSSLTMLRKALLMVSGEERKRIEEVLANRNNG